MDENKLAFQELEKEEFFLNFLLEKANAEESFHEFVRQAWHAIEGKTPFIDGWHIDAICDHIEAVTRYDVNNLMIHVPPRTSKSTIVSVMLPAWVWCTNPTETFLYASYSAELSLDLSVKCRRLITSEWYQKRWGHKFKLVGDQNTKSKFENDEGGIRIASSAGGTITGLGANITILDDPNNAKDGESAVKRDATNNWFTQSWSTRNNNPKKYGRIIVQQRLHENDVSGFILNSESCDDWVKLILPMEYEEGRECKTIHLPYMKKDQVWRDPRTKDGILLCPDRMDLRYVLARRKELGSYGYAGQYQQRPSPEGGGILRKEWFEIWNKERTPRIDFLVQSWDTALETGDKNAYSACTTWGVFKDDYGCNNLILLGLWRDKVEYPELRKLARQLYYDYRNDGQTEVLPDGKHKADQVIVEAKVSGFSLIQDLHRAGIPISRFNPNKYGDKMQRVKIASALIEDGRVWVPAMAPDYRKLRKISTELLENCASFPNADSRDLVDTLTQVILRLKESGWLQHSEDEELNEERKAIKTKMY